MSRKAFLGLSSPLAYDYKPHQSRIHSKDASAPNPILEDSMGLLLFYDEIVFLSRQLCPENMRSLEYVSFLTDRDDFARRIDVIQLPDLEKADHPLGDNDFRSLFDIFTDVISMITGQPHLVNSDEAQFIIDYHTHQFYLTNTINFRASSPSTGDS